MAKVERAEQLPLPEQLYLLLIDPDTGEPRADRERAKRALATSVLWELVHSDLVRTEGDEVTGMTDTLSPLPYLRRGQLIARRAAPSSAASVVLELASELHPIWRAIGESMVGEHLVAEESQQRFILFHRRVLRELTQARAEGRELVVSLREAARQTWDAHYESDVARTHPRLLARVVILDNYGLLAPLLGASYAAMSAHLPEVRAHLRALVGEAGAPPAEEVARVRAVSASRTWAGDSSGTGIYDSGSGWWIDAHDYGGGHGGDGHDHGHGDHDGHHGHDGQDGDHDGGGHDGGGDSGGGDGGGSGGCGGCGGCGG